MTTQYEPTFVNETLQNEMLNLVLTALGMAEDGDHYTDLTCQFYRLISFTTEEAESFMNTYAEDVEIFTEIFKYDAGEQHAIFTQSLNVKEVAKILKEYMAWRMLKELMYCFDLETSIDLSLAQIWLDGENYPRFVSYIQSQLV